MQVKYYLENYTSIECDILAYPVFEEDAADTAPLASLDKATQKTVSSVLASREFQPELHQVCKIYRPGGLRAARLLLVGAGKKAEFTPAKLRDVAGTAVRTARAAFCKKIAFVCPKDPVAGIAARLVTEGAIYANYDADLYKTKDKEDRDIESFIPVFESNAKTKEIEEGIRRGIIAGEAVNLARTLANEPANILTPAEFAARAVNAAAAAGLDVRVMEREEMESLGMNALLAVGKGSDQPPKMVVLHTKGALKKGARKASVAVIGKGVTFDSGGISIKPSEKMEEMKGDMAGGAAVLGTMLALAQLCPQKPVIGIIPLVENLPSGKATKPGDVVKSCLGKTIEIINTDAEGRLILADAIAYARTLGATRILDAATLTGACAVALGNVNGGMMGTDQKTIDRLRANCRVTGEGLWQLPLDDAYRKAIRSEIADIKNVGNRMGGAITAAKFLQEFVEDTPWVHLDIAGMDVDTEGRPFASKGATGFGVRTFLQLLEGNT
jgi:leucyl aminopeptidase